MYIYSLNKMKFYSLLFSSVWTGLQFHHVVKGSQILIFIYGLESRLGVLEWSWGAVLEWILEVEPWRESCEWNRKYLF